MPDKHTPGLLATCALGLHRCTPRLHLSGPVRGVLFLPPTPAIPSLRRGALTPSRGPSAALSFPSAWLV
jgi:hypothetical protein